MSRNTYQKRERLQEIKTEYGLTEIGANFFDPGGQINLLQTVAHQAMINSAARGDIVNSLNILQLATRLERSIVISRFTDEENEIFYAIMERADQLEDNDMSGRFKIAFEAYDYVNQVLDNELTKKEYIQEENNHKGILSDLISKRIANYDQNWIMGIHGLTRSGKTRAAGRLGYNINKKVEAALKRKVGFSSRDWVFNKQQYLNRLRERKEEGSLKGSVVVLEEAGDMLNSQRFWDEDVVGSVDILRQQGYNNTCLIIISQLHKDVVNKARGLMHCVMIPWKDYRSRPMELDEVTNIDFDRGISWWKIDTLDVNPIDGKAYPQGIKVALGKVTKLGVLMPPTALNNQIGKRDEKHKDQKMDDQYYKTIRESLTRGDRQTLTKCAKEILAEVDKYKNPSGTWKTSKIGNKWGLGGRLALRVRDTCQEILDKENKGSVAEQGRRSTEDGKIAGSIPATPKPEEKQNETTNQMQ